MPVAPRIVNDVSYVTGINHACHFTWQAFKCSCHGMKRDRGADAWNKSDEITHQDFSYQCWAACAAKDRHGFL